MKTTIEVELDHIHLLRGGDILFHCLWLQGIMIDFLILKKHKKIIKKINKPPPYKIPAIMVKKRALYWKKDFFDVKEEFIKEFKPEKVIINKINRIYLLRNILSHSNVKLERKYFLFKPKKLNKIKKLKVFNLDKIPNQSKPVILKLDYSQEKSYLSDFEIIQYLDQLYFKKEAEKIGVVYSRLR